MMQSKLTLVALIIAGLASPVVSAEAKMQTHKHFKSQSQSSTTTGANMKPGTTTGANTKSSPASQGTDHAGTMPEKKQ